MQDYILRLIEQFAGTIASIASRRRQGERKEARQEAELLAPSLLGVELDLLAFYGQEQIREEILSLGGDVEARLRLAS